MAALVPDLFSYIKRGRGSVLLHAGHEYYVKRKHATGLTIWICKNRKTCGGRLRIKSNRIVDEEPHECVPDHANNEIQLSLYKCKQQITAPEFPCVPTKYNSMVANLQNAGFALVTDVPKFTSVKSSLYRYKNKAAELDKIHCRDIAEVVVPGRYQSFLFADYAGNGKRIIIFASEEATQTLQEVSDFYGDGTFRSCPAPFKEIYTIHGDLGSSAQHTNIVPLLYVLMSDKKAETYVTLFDLIKARVPQWNPRKFKIDYENATIKALTIALPNTEVKGCYFHFSKAVWKKGRDLGILRSNNPQNIKKVALSALLPLLPQNEIINGWQYILALGNNDDPTLIRFLTYMERQWLRNDHFISMWCAYGEKHRTTNSLEAWHLKLNRAISKKAPNVMHLLYILKEDASFYKARYQQIRRNAPLKKRSKKNILTDELIQDAQLELLMGNITVGHFLESLRR